MESYTHELKIPARKSRLSFTKFALLLALSLTLPVLCRAQLTTTGGEINVPYSGTTATVLVANTPSANLNITSGTNTFLLAVNPVQNAVRLYVQNDTANSCANLQISFAATGNQNATSFNNQIAAWQAVQYQIGTGGFGSAAQTFTLPASGTVSITTAPVIGSRLAINLVLTPASSCATTNLEAQAVFGQFTPTQSSVQGIFASGVASASAAPVIVGGTDQFGFARQVSIWNNGSANGFQIGGTGAGAGSTYAGLAVGPAGSNNGPLQVVPFLYTAGRSGTEQAITGPGSGANLYPCNTNAQSCMGIYTTDTGYMFSNNFAISTAGTSTRTLGSVDAAGGAAVQTCRVEFTATNTAGTTPTLDAYFQDSIDGTTYSDRVHFPQCTTGTCKFWTTLSGNQPSAVLSGTTNTATPIITPQSNSLAVNTVVQGALGEKFQFSFVTTGTTPTYSGNIYINCK